MSFSWYFAMILFEFVVEGKQGKRLRDMSVRAFNAGSYEHACEIANLFKENYNDSYFNPDGQKVTHRVVCVVDVSRHSVESVTDGMEVFFKCFQT